ncbi:MAG TPA: VWA domain-containing protein [Anaerolineales bacterium]|jgi:hypothetical protein
MADPGPGHDLLARIVGFAGFLRLQGLPVGTRRVAALVEALALIDLTDRRAVQTAVEASLVGRYEDLAILRAAFDHYWSGQAGLLDPPAAEVQRTPAVDEGSPPGYWRPTAGTAPDDGAAALDLAYSAVEVLRTKDFGQMTEVELAQAERRLAGLTLWPARRHGRRWQSGSGRRLDLRHSLRAGLAYGGEWLELRRLNPAPTRPPLLVLADISGSMALYSRLLLAFCYGLARRRQPPVEVFVFGTRLSRVTSLLRRHPVGAALDGLRREVSDWSGGTRTGEALQRLHIDWGRRMLSRRPVVLILSDGWDRGDPSLLAAGMARLARSAERLIWLNPLVGKAGYRPLTRGLQASLAHVDDFLPAHNLASLESLLAVLSQPNQPSSVHIRQAA